MWRLLLLSASLENGAAHAVEDKDDGEVQAVQAGEAVEQSAHLRVLARVVVTVSENGGTLFHPYAVILALAMMLLGTEEFIPRIDPGSKYFGGVIVIPLVCRHHHLGERSLLSCRAYKLGGEGENRELK